MKYYRSTNKHGSKDAVTALLSQLQPHRRWQLSLIVLLMIVGGLAEIVSLGLIVPFLAFLIDPLEALQIELVATVSSIFGPADPNSLRLWFTLLFIVAAVVSGAMRFLVVFFEMFWSCENLAHSTILKKLRITFATSV